MTSSSTENVGQSLSPDGQEVSDRANETGTKVIRGSAAAMIAAMPDDWSDDSNCCAGKLKSLLLPCPFCGGSASMSEMDERDERRCWFRTISCDSCDASIEASMGWGRYRKLSDEQAADDLAGEVSAQWNTRSYDGEADSKLALKCLAEMDQLISKPGEPEVYAFDSWPDDAVIFDIGKRRITAGDLRRARSVISNGGRS